MTFLCRFFSQVRLEEVTENLENEVIATSRTLQKDLAGKDQRIGEIIGEMNQDLILVTKEFRYVEDCWAQIQTELEKRGDDILSYSESMEALESMRARTVSSELTGLVERLTAIAYKPSTEIERFVSPPQPPD